MINIEWNYKENPKRSGYYTVTVEDLNGSNTHVLFHVWYDCDFGWCVGKQNVLIVSAWAEDIVPENIEPYKKEEEFKVGDIIRTDTGYVGIVTRITAKTAYIMWDDGSCAYRDKDKIVEKIGEYKEVQSVLEAIGNARYNYLL